MRRRTLALVLGVSVAQAAHAGDPIGHVKTRSGDARIVRAGAPLQAELGLAVEVGDVLATGADGSLGVTLRDNTLVSIGPATEYSLDQFAFEPAQQKLGFASKLSKGTLQFVSGTIAKLAPESVKVGTPTGTLGVRGTRFVVKVSE